MAVENRIATWNEEERRIRTNSTGVEFRNVSKTGVAVDVSAAKQYYTGGAVTGTGGAVTGTGGAVTGTGGAVTGTGAAVTGTGAAVTGTGGAVCKGATPAVEQ